MATATFGDRIKAEFTARTKQKQAAKDEQASRLKDREARLKVFGDACERLSAIWKPRLEEFAKQFGEQVKTTPTVTPGHRQAKFQFMTDLASVSLTLAAAPDADVKKLVLDYDLSIIPMLMEYERYARLEMPLEAIDEKAVGAWVEDRLLDCVKTYLLLQDNEFYLKRQMVEDPVTKVKFVRSDAAGSVTHEGTTHYFVSEQSIKEFKKKMQIA